MDAKLTFANWPVSVHTDKAQQRRIEKAQKARTGVANIDSKSKKGVFFGTGTRPYVTTLEHCTCPDYDRRGLPCKHMYRLAIELGEFGNEMLLANTQLSLQQAVAEVENFTDDAQLFISQHIFNNSDAFTVIMTPEYSWLRECHLFVPLPVSVDSLKMLKSGEIKAALEAAGARDFPRKSKDAMIAWARDNCPEVVNILFSAQSTSRLRAAGRFLYIYLRWKYDWSEVQDDGPLKGLKYPRGAKCYDRREPNIYYYPNTEIVDLLTLYKHNRCEGGFDVLTGTSRGPNYPSCAEIDTWGKIDYDDDEDNSRFDGEESEYEPARYSPLITADTIKAKEYSAPKAKHCSELKSSTMRQAVKGKPKSSTNIKLRPSWLLILAIMFIAVGVYGAVTVAVSSGSVGVIIGLIFLCLYLKELRKERKR